MIEGWVGAAITSKEYRTGEAIEGLNRLGSCFFFRLKVTTTQGASGKGLLFAILQFTIRELEHHLSVLV